MGEANAVRGPYYRPADVARLLHCSQWWVKEQARRRRIPFCWIGGSYLFTEEHVAAIVRLFEVRPQGDVPVVGRRGSAASADCGDGPAVLRARPPRRSRRINRPAA